MFALRNNHRAGQRLAWLGMVFALIVALVQPGLALAAPLDQKPGDSTVLTYGDSVTGSITEANFEVLYTFEGAAGDVVTVTMRRTDTALDPYLFLSDASGTNLASDDDSAGERDAQISGFTLPADGTYTIVATRYNGSDGTTTGSYTLQLASGTTPAEAPETLSGGAFGGLPIGNGNDDGVDLGNGDSGANGTTAASGTFAFTCDGVEVPAASLVTFNDVRAGFTYQVTVIGLDGFDPIIGLEAEDGSGLCNDDAPDAVGSQVDVPGVGLVTANNLTSQIQFTTTGATGDIAMYIGGFGGQGGRYAAVFEGLAIAPANEQDEVIINVAPTVANDEIYVYMVSETNALDPYMTLLGSDFVCDDVGVGACADTPAFSGGGVAIANGSVYVAGQYDAGIGVVPNDSGDLVFQFGSYNGGTSGDYAMIVVGSVPGAGGSAPTTNGGTNTGSGDVALVYGDSATGSINDATPYAAYVFDGQAGDQVSIRMESTSGDLDPYLGLLDADFNVVVEDDDSGGGYNALIETTLPATGTYYIIASRYDLEDGTSSGSFNLSLTSGGAGNSGSTGSTGTTGTIPTVGAGVEEPWSAAPTLNMGDVVQHTIDAVDWGWGYTFNGQAGQTVTVTMEAAPGSSLDPYLLLLNADEEIIGEDDDGAGDLNSQIVLSLPTTGRYYILATRYGADEGTSVGSFVLSLSADGSTGATTTTTSNTTTTGSGELNYNLEPSFGAAELVSGFTNDPYTVNVTSGGPVDVRAAVGGTCEGTPSGFANTAPDFRLNYTNGEYSLRFFFATAEGDTSLIINAPDGGWYCDDDSGGELQPLINFITPLSGQYDVWVGSYVSSEFVPGTLAITEQDIMPSDLSGSK